MRIVLRIGKECKGNICPIPITLLPSVKKEVKSIKELSDDLVEIEYDEKENKNLVGMLKKMGYDVKG